MHRLSQLCSEWDGLCTRMGAEGVRAVVARARLAAWGMRLARQAYARTHGMRLDQRYDSLATVLTLFWHVR